MGSFYSIRQIPCWQKRVSYPRRCCCRLVASVLAHFWRDLFVGQPVKVSEPDACAFWQVSILVLADKPAPRRRLHPSLWVVWVHSLCEPLICQPLAGRR